MNETASRWVAFETWTWTAKLPTEHLDLLAHTAASRSSTATGDAGRSSRSSIGQATRGGGRVPLDPENVLRAAAASFGGGAEHLLLFEGLDTVTDVHVGDSLVLQVVLCGHWEQVWMAVHTSG